jgi:mRNA deadenylase 3'-5' endonuclease subunit Ccr4
LIIEEIAQIQPHIICLQEVDNYKEFYLQQLSKLGYEGVYKQKTNGKEDGCAIFYNRDDFYVLSNTEVEYNDIAKKDPTFYMTDNVAQVVKLSRNEGASTCSKVYKLLIF